MARPGQRQTGARRNAPRKQGRVRPDGDVLSVLARTVRELEAAVQGGRVTPSVRTKFQAVAMLLRDERAPGASGDPEIGLMSVTIPTRPGRANGADELRRLAQTVSGCDDFARSVHEADSSATVGTLKAKLSEMNPTVRSTVANLPVGHVSEPLPVGNGVQAVMVCSRQGGEAAIPSLDDVGRVLTAQKLEQFSQRLLRDLRQTAFIDLRV